MNNNLQEKLNLSDKQIESMNNYNVIDQIYIEDLDTTAIMFDGIEEYYFFSDNHNEYAIRAGYLFQDTDEMMKDAIWLRSKY